MSKLPLSPWQRPHQVMCPHCGKKHDVTEWREIFGQKPQIECNPGGCGKKFEIAVAQQILFVRTRPL